MSQVRVEIAREALARGVPVRVRVYGASMAPSLVDGVQVEIRPLAGPPLPGEVVAWERGGRLVVHRVVSVDSEGRVVTQGDARAVLDPPCPRSAVLGRVVLPSGKRPRRSLIPAWARRLLAYASSR